MQTNSNPQIISDPSDYYQSIYRKSFGSSKPLNSQTYPQSGAQHGYVNQNCDSQPVCRSADRNTFDNLLNTPDFTAGPLTTNRHESPVLMRDFDNTKRTRDCCLDNWGYSQCSQNKSFLGSANFCRPFNPVAKVNNTQGKERNSTPFALKEASYVYVDPSQPNFNIVCDSQLMLSQTPGCYTQELFQSPVTMTQNTETGSPLLDLSPYLNTERIMQKYKNESETTVPVHQYDGVSLQDTCSNIVLNYLSDACNNHGFRNETTSNVCQGQGQPLSLSLSERSALMLMGTNDMNTNFNNKSGKSETKSNASGSTVQKSHASGLINRGLKTLQSLSKQYSCSSSTSRQYHTGDKRQKQRDESNEDLDEIGNLPCLIKGIIVIL